MADERLAEGGVKKTIICQNYLTFEYKRNNI